jgi:hypothetical protein
VNTEPALLQATEEAMAKAKRKTATRAAKKARAGERRTLSGAAGEYTIRGEGALLAVIRPKQTKHGPRRRWRENEFAQLGIQALYGGSPSEHIDVSKATRDVNAWLNNRPDYRATGLGEISRPTVLRALKALRRP